MPSFYRSYEQADETVRAFYRENRANQTYQFASAQRESLSRGSASVAQLFDMADQVLDPSDPDLALSQLQHALQTAEAARSKFPESRYDWLHLTALLHDLGKGPLAQGGNDVKPLPMWAIVGDTFPLGCRFDERNVLGEGYADNPDAAQPRYASELGIYKLHCGLDKVVMSYGHDEYMANLLERNEVSLPEVGIYVVRYHSFYPWHQHGAYAALCDAQDHPRLEWLQRFQQCDLYSKCPQELPAEELLPYYRELGEKYLGGWDKPLQL